MGVRYVDKITGEPIDSPADSTTAKAAGLPAAEIPPPVAPELTSLPSEEDSQTEETEDLDNGQ